jgi:glycosyltransferase involved in cell wall biosynthesis
VPRVSVIVPVFNRPAFVGEAIRSALSQECPGGLEIVVVDDGSTDDTPRVLADLASADDRVRVIRQENAGPAHARNHAMREAQGDLLALLDSDDVWLPGKLAAQVALLDAHPAAAFAHSDVDEFWEDGDGAWTRRPPIVSGDVLRILLKRNVIHTMTVVLRRAVIEEVGGFDPAYPPCEDWDLWLRITARHPVVGDPERRVRVRLHEGGISSDPLVVYRQATRLLAAAAERLADEGHAEAGFARRQAARWHVKYGRRLARADRTDEARDAYATASRLHPMGRLEALRARLFPK